MDEEIVVHRYCSRDVCGHTEMMHRHYRAGNDCGICGKDVCPVFKIGRFWSDVSDYKAKLSARFGKIAKKYLNKRLKV